MFNTVRRMTDTNLTILPLSKVTFRVGYSQNIFQGPTLSPARSVGKYDSLAWSISGTAPTTLPARSTGSPWRTPRSPLKSRSTHYKADSYFTLDPERLHRAGGGWNSGLAGRLGRSMYRSLLQSPPATRAAWGLRTPVRPTLTYTIFTAPKTPGGLPIVNPACDVITSYLRSQPTRRSHPPRFCGCKAQASRTSR